MLYDTNLTCLVSTYVPACKHANACLRVGIQTRMNAVYIPTHIKKLHVSMAGKKAGKGKEKTINTQENAVMKGAQSDE